MESKKSIKRNLPIAGVCFIIPSKPTSLSQNGTGEDCCQEIKIKKQAKKYPWHPDNFKHSNDSNITLMVAFDLENFINLLNSEVGFFFYQS